ncbi:MAG: hypothetical protein ACREEO_11765 [Phenylobacterium sp.]
MHVDRERKQELRLVALFDRTIPPAPRRHFAHRHQGIASDRTSRSAASSAAAPMVSVFKARMGRGAWPADPRGIVAGCAFGIDLPTPFRHKPATCAAFRAAPPLLHDRLGRPIFPCGNAVAMPEQGPGDGP